MKFEYQIWLDAPKRMRIHWFKLNGAFLFKFYKIV